MAEYIEREKIVGILNDNLGNSAIRSAVNGYPEEYFDGWTDAVSEAITEVEDIPAADVRPERHGFWEWSKLPNGYNEFKCSACGAREATTIIPHFWVKDGYHEYCGVCGAKMDGINQKGDIK